MKCPYCSKDVEKFHPNSHIIPEWMYKNSYDEHHRAVSLNLNSKTKILVQKGHRGSFICEECEKMFSYDDTYASQLFSQNPKISKIRKDLLIETKAFNLDLGLTEVSYWRNFDFKRLQNFIFSVLIRNHLWKDKNQKLHLPEEHYEKIKFLYQNVIIINDYSYPILVIKLNKSNIHDPVFLPYVNVLGTENVYTFAGAGYIFHTIIPKNNVPTTMMNMRLRSDGRVWMIHTDFESTGILQSSLPSIRKIKEKELRK